MEIVPDSKITLIKNPLKLDSNNEMMFANKTEQYNYFNSLPKLEYTELTYIRKDDVIRVQTKDDLHPTAPTFEDLLEYNFCMYQNTHFSNKWFYAFITDIKWINPSLTEIKIETAYYQTWQFDLIFADSFIEREHVNDDTIGKHTIPEGLETGEYVNQNLINSTDDGDNYMLNTQFVVALTSWPYDSAQPVNYHVYNGLFSGFIYLAFNSTEDLRIFLIDIQGLNIGDPISSIFVVPSALTTLSSTDFQVLVTGKTWKAAWVPNTTSYINMGNFYISDIKTIDQDYSPINKKLLCYPYRYILVNNNAGSSMDYRYEWFYTKDAQENVPRCVFSIYGVISPGCSIKLFPQSYNEVQGNNFIPNYLYSLDGGKLPTCSWWNDPYTNWLTQNAVNMPLQALGNVFNIGKSAFTGNIGNLTSGLMGIGQQVGEIYAHSLEPATGKGGVNQGDLMYSAQRSFTFKRMSIRKEYAKVIDDFFTQFGYKVNRLGTPHLHVRTYYDYIKTIDVNIEGNVPENDLNKIREMFNNGIRFWHDTSKYLDFSVDNNIILTPTPETTIIDTDIIANGVNNNKGSYINLLGNTSQTGTPTPDNPKPIYVVTDNNIIQISNYNDTLQRFYLINLGDLELCKIGDYQDYFYKSSGKWYLHKELDKEKLTSNNVVYHGVSGDRYQYEFTPTATPDLSQFILSTHFKYKASASWWLYDNNIVITTESYRNRIYMTTSEYTTISDFNNFTSSNDVYVLYPLATPTNTEITDTTLINQLNNLYTSTLYDGTNKLTTITNNLKPYIKLHYNI